MERLTQDLRYALRLLLRSRAFTATAVATIALAVGANTALFSVVDGVLLRPLPFRAPGRLVRVWEANPSMNLPFFSVSRPNLTDWRAQARSFEDVAAYRRARRNVTGDPPELLETAAVSAGFFDVLGVSPRIGRTFAAGEDGPGARPLAVIGDGLWRRRFASDPGVVGRTLTLDGQPHEVVGVLPATFELLEIEVWTPLVPTPDLENRRQHVLGVLARLRDGATVEGARAELGGVASRLEAQYPDSNRGWTVRIESVRDWLVDPTVRQGLLVLAGAVGFVLLIACANLASLQIARGSARQRELAVRAALGAGRGRLTRQLLTESVLVALLGGAAGLALAYWGVEALKRLGPAGVPRLDDVTVDARVLAFNLAVSVFAGVLFGLAPALQSARTASEALREGTRTAGASPARRRLRGALVVAEVALSLVLLVGAGLLVRTLLALHRAPLGFDPAGVITAQLNLPRTRYESRDQQLALYDEVLRRVRAVPGVDGAALTNIAPFAGGNSGIDVRAEEALDRAETGLAADWRAVSPGFFQVMKVPLRSGRTFAESDRGDSPCVVLASQRLAETLWPGRDAVGRRLRGGGADQGLCTVIGVVGNVRHVELDDEARPALYLAAGQFPRESATLVVRSAARPEAVLAAVRGAVAAVDPELPLSRVRTLEDLVQGASAQPRFHTLLLGLMAGLALVLAVVGLYGLLAMWVGERTREFGIRLAIGARPAHLLSLVLGQGLGLALVGLGLGIPAAWAASRLLGGLVYGVSVTDAATYAGVSLLLAATAALACYVPARRAARVDPSVALRYE
jgi:predicted permease